MEKLTNEQINKLLDLSGLVIWARADEELCPEELKDYYSERTLEAWAKFDACVFSTDNLTSGQHDELIRYIMEETKTRIDFIKAGRALNKAKRELTLLLVD